MTPTPAKVFAVFKIHYQLIPLEAYGSNPYKTLVSTLLSSRTRDETIFAVCEHLFKEAKNFKSLVSLPGVGRKTANIVLARAFGIPAIGVDAHVHRVTNALGWVHTKTPEQTERELVKILPKKYWLDTNRLMVSIGRQYRSAHKLTDFLQEQKLIR